MEKSTETAREKEQKRTKAFQLPQWEELLSILSHEGKRAVPFEKESAHFTDWSTVISLLRELNVNASFFTESFELEEFSGPDRIPKLERDSEDFVNTLIERQDDPVVQGLCNEVYDYLSETDPLSPADVIFVFGSKTTLRTEKALELFRMGLAPKIMVSGKGPFYANIVKGEEEAELLAEYLIKRGVPHGSVILETESITVPDNVKRSLNLLDHSNIPHQKIILVNSAFAQRRGFAHFSKFSMPGTMLIRCNVEKVSPQFSRDGWYRSAEGAATILKEFFSLKASTILNTA